MRVASSQHFARLRARRSQLPPGTGIPKRSRRYALLAAAVVVMATHPTAASAAPGDLDRSFGADGVVAAGFADQGQPGGSFARDVAVQPDGKAVVVGPVGDDFGIARFEEDGSLDQSFGDNGRVRTDLSDLYGSLSELTRDIARAVAVQRDGKIVVGGWVVTEGCDGPCDPRDADLALARYNADGSLDESFGVRGRVVKRYRLFERVTDLGLTPDGKIVAVASASAEPGHPTGNLSVLLVFRFDSTGAPDRSFSGNGRSTTRINSRGSHTALDIDDEGRIVAATGRTIARYRADGRLDREFSGDGRAEPGFTSVGEFEAVATQPGGGVVAAGTMGGFRNFDFGLLRLQADGRVDRAFGSQGRVRTDLGGLDVASAVEIQPGGRIVAAGEAGRDGRAGAALVGYLPSGRLDRSFSGDGKVITRAGGLVGGTSLAQGPGRKLTLAALGSPGGASERSDFLVARFLGQP